MSVSLALQHCKRVSSNGTFFGTDGAVILLYSLWQASILQYVTRLERPYQLRVVEAVPLRLAFMKYAKFGGKDDLHGPGVVADEDCNCRVDDIE